MKMGGGPKQFGIDVEQVPDVLRQVGQLGLSFEGYHLFAGSQNLKADSICDAQQKSYELALRLAEFAPTPVRFLNLGGGFGIPYFPGEQRLDLAPIGANLSVLVERAGREMPQAHIVIELGRYFVGEAGIYVTRVVDRKVVTRAGVSGVRRGLEPPLVGIGQLRPGGAQEPPCDHWQPDGRRARNGHRGWAAVHGRWTCWQTAWTCRWRRLAIWW